MNVVDIHFYVIIFVSRILQSSEKSIHVALVVLQLRVLTGVGPPTVRVYRGLEEILVNYLCLQPALQSPTYSLGQGENVLTNYRTHSVCKHK